MSNRAGFSVLELLIGLALLAVIGAGLAGAMRLGTETYNRAQVLGSDSDYVAARAQLRRFLGRAMVPAAGASDFPTEFTGSRTSFTFTTLVPMGFARDTAGAKITIALDEGTLTALIAPFDDDGRTIQSHTAVLAEDVSHVEFRYFADNQWHQRWSGNASLPKLVQIDLDDQTRPYWPEFTVELVYAD